MSVKLVNPNADVIGQKHALATNVAAANGLASILKSNLGPKGTLKMLVGGAGQVKLTKDGKVLLDEMPLQHPTAALIARTATAQDDITGDGTTSNVLFIGELMKQAERHIHDGLHPRIIVDGFEKAREIMVSFLEEYKDEIKESPDTETKIQVAQTALRTKVHEELADHLASIVVKAVDCVNRDDSKIDLHMIELMHMTHKSVMDTRYVNGLVLDHGARHPKMAKKVENCFIFVCNVSLEYEKSEVNSQFFWKDAAERERLVAAERKFTDDKVEQIIKFKKSVCDGTDKKFVVINQKGIDPISLELLYREGIVALRRAKRRNMERLALACGGYAVNSVDNLNEDCLGYADLVYEHQLGDEKFTFVEGCKNPGSCTILIRGPDEHSIRQVKDAIRDGLNSLVNVIQDKALIAGAGAFEAAGYHKLIEAQKELVGPIKLGLQIFADGLLIIPKTLAENAGLDRTKTLLTLLEETAKGKKVGINLETGECLEPKKSGIWDNYRVKKQLLHLGSLIAIKLLLVDEIMRAGRKMGKE